MHKIRTRGQPHSGHADLHVQVRPDLRIDEAHAIGHQVVDRLRGELGLRDVVTHVEPAGRPYEGQAEQRPEGGPAEADPTADVGATAHQEIPT